MIFNQSIHWQRYRQPEPLEPLNGPSPHHHRGDEHSDCAGRPAAGQLRRAKSPPGPSGSAAVVPLQLQAAADHLVSVGQGCPGHGPCVSRAERDSGCTKIGPDQLADPGRHAARTTQSKSSFPLRRFRVRQRTRGNAGSVWARRDPGPTRWPARSGLCTARDTSLTTLTFWSGPQLGRNGFLYHTQPTQPRSVHTARMLLVDYVCA
jgi:hypothetical protein